MHRRDAVKAIAITSITPNLVLARPGRALLPAPRAAEHLSDWDQWPDVKWAGPSYWGNRLQDWEIRDGKATCNVSGRNRTLHCLTTQMTAEPGRLEMEVEATRLNKDDSTGGYLGFRLGARGPFDDYRSAAVFGKGLDVGINQEGHLFIGDTLSTGELMAEELHLRLVAEPNGDNYRLTLEATDRTNANKRMTFSANSIPTQSLVGNMALVAHFPNDSENDSSPSASFASWKINGSRLQQDESQVWGPVCFAYYTLHRGTLKLNAQLAPIEALSGHQVALQVKEGGDWKTLQTQKADKDARVAQFRIENWPYSQEAPYRVALSHPSAGG